MKPLSPATYYLRNKGQAYLLLFLICLTILGMYLMPAFAIETFSRPERVIKKYLQKFNIVQSKTNTGLDPSIVAKIRAHPDVEIVIPQNNIKIDVPNVGGMDFEFHLFGLNEADIDTIFTCIGASLLAGERLEPRTNGLMLSEQVVTSLGLELGDTIDQSLDKDIYQNIVSPLQLVGILSGDVRVGVVSYEYLANHEFYGNSIDHGYLVLPRPGRELSLDNWLRAEISSQKIDTFTHQWLEEQVVEEEAEVHVIGIPIDILITIATTLVIGAINQLAFMRRIKEFGILHAAGHSKRSLIQRLTLETAGIAILGWILGVGCSLLAMSLISKIIYQPNGYELTLFHIAPFLFTTPIPIACIGFTLFSARRAFSRIDVITIIEKGKIRSDTKKTSNLPKKTSSFKPLASTTFYKRHKGQAFLLISTMALMIVGVAVLIFAFTATWDAQAKQLGNLARMSIIAPRTKEIAPVTIAKIRNHPAVERAIPSIIISPFDITIPPMGGAHFQSFAVSAEDMGFLLDLYNLELREGKLPLPNTNQLIIPDIAAKNRDLNTGDVVGSRDYPIYKHAPSLPSDLIISGIFSTNPDSVEENWLSFVSIEYLQAYQDLWKTELSYLVVPKPGQKPMLDLWLESEFQEDLNIEVITYQNSVAANAVELRSILMIITMLEIIIAVVAAITLAGLNFIFISQRFAELGVLKALGYSHQKLVFRTMRETIMTTGIAWILSVVLCVIALLILLYGLFRPLGLGINFFNPIPWLYTFPVPLAVLFVTTFSAGWILSRLDPVTIIERR